MSQSAFEDIQANPAKTDLVDFDMTWPYVELGDNVELQESEGSHEVDLAGQVHLNMNLLIEAQVSTDIISWPILYAGPHGQLLEEIRTKAAEGVGNDSVNASAEISANIVIDGAVNAALEWNKQCPTPGPAAETRQPWWPSGWKAKRTPKPKSSASSLSPVWSSGSKARSKDEGIGIIAELHASTAETQPAVGGKVTFTGLAVYRSYYAEAGVEDASSERKKENAHAEANMAPKHQKPHQTLLLEIPVRSAM